MSMQQNKKFYSMYKSIASTVAEQSYCVRRKVGACIVTTGGIVAIGFNGTESGKPNVCELPDGTTDPSTIHAEVNALNKLTKADAKDSIIFVTTAPCIVCAELLSKVGIREVHYKDIQSNIDGLNFLKKFNIPTFRY
jgi:dCMP deaminase